MPEQSKNNLESRVKKSEECSLKEKLALPYVGLLLFGGFSFLGALNYYDRINSPVLAITGTAAAIGAVAGYVTHRMIDKYLVRKKPIEKQP